MGSKVLISGLDERNELYPRINKALSNVGYDTVSFDWKRGRTKTMAKDLKWEVKECDACFAFSASETKQNGEFSEHVLAETTLASSLDIPVVLFNEKGEEFNTHFPFFNVYVSFTPEDLPLQLQEQVEEVEERKGHEGVGLVGGGLLGLAAVGTGGAALVGALIGGALLSGKEQKSLVECPSCDMVYGYWGTETSFDCPQCHYEVVPHTDSVEPDRID